MGNIENVQVKNTVLWVVTPCSLERVLSELHGVRTHKTVPYIPHRTSNPTMSK
jgi:hypothetical protein